MAPQVHTYGPTCHLGPTVAFTGSKDNEGIPPLKAQYFYSSPQPIDDPLSVVPIPSGADAKSANHPPRPFSPYDNEALEAAWLLAAAGKDNKGTTKSNSKSTSDPDSPKRTRSKIGAAISTITGHEHGKHQRNKSPKALERASVALVVDKATVQKAAENAEQKAPQKDKKGKHKSHADAPLQEADLFTINEDGSAKMQKDKHESKDLAESVVPSPVVAPAATTEKVSGKDKEAKKKSKRSKKSTEHTEDTAGQTSAKSATNDHRTESSEDDARSNNCDDLDKPQNAIRADSISCAELDKPQARDSVQNSSIQCDELVVAGPAVVVVAGPSDSSKATTDDNKSKSSKKWFKKDKSSTKDSPKDVKLLINAHPTTSTEAPTASKAQNDGADDTEPEDPISNMDGNENAKDKSPMAPEASSFANDAGTTGQPFLKMTDKSQTTEPSAINAHSKTEQAPSAPATTKKRTDRESTESETVEVPGCKSQKNAKPVADVPVGVSRLHMVTMPALQMKPIYWSPVHDIAAVTRGTWFYKDTMYPVEPAVANQLELGYMELKPWSQTWSDELSSAIEVGAAGEEKIAHRLWPKNAEAVPSTSRKITKHALYANPLCAAKCFEGEAAAEGILDLEDAEKQPAETKTAVKKYSSAQVIYRDVYNAFILKSALQPSAYYGRKPLAKIRKGAAVGIHVVRGFDWKAWLKLHPSKKTATTAKTEDRAAVAGDSDNSKGVSCPACKSEEVRPNVTDLVLVIHGIGQKLSERMESFNFTHAINGVRRSVNAELANDAVQKTLREDLGGVMVLPVNWRTNLSFDDKPKKENTGAGPSDFTLKDITQDSLPAVRNIISDVMLDIPFYMSHHKPKMIQAVVTEANRVYQLWCKNNPQFQEAGRVHIIAHSLGCAMTLEILSKQPTTVPKSNPAAKKINTKYFDFNTSNLFLCGSPAGFFLLLDKGRLLPRKGQGKPGVDGHDDTDPAIVGEAGTYGCMAVNNVYNIMHVNDPIAYRLNATVDPQYAASLKYAQVPSATTGFFESIGNAVRAVTPGVASPSDLVIGQVAKPAALPRLPSQLEMEVHDFTREELAEKKFYLMNDCGQVDWFLKSGGGPLEIQYLNMLSAHSSYWLSPDFIRFIVLEVGRKPGRSNTLPNTRVAKAGRKA